MNSWNLEESKELIVRAYGKTQLDLVEQSMNSMGLRQNFATYHYQEYRNIYDEFQTKLTATKTWTVADLEESNILEVKIAANILACLQNLHTIHDTLGQVIRYVFDLKFNNENIYLSNIKDELKNLVSYKDLFGLLKELIENEDYKYLNSFMNKSKHNALVLPYYQKSFIDRSEGVKIPAFMHKSDKYPEKNAEIFLVAVYTRESNLLVAIGQEINKLITHKIEAE